MAKLSGKVALVSGSGRGIGRSIALKLASGGARVVVNVPFRILRAAQPVIRQANKADAEAGREVFRKIVNISSVAGSSVCGGGMSI